MTASLQHPAWCDTTKCTNDDRHYSRTLTVPAARDGDPEFELRLYVTAYAPVGDELPIVEFGVTLDDGELQQAADVDIDLTQVRRLHAALGAVLHVYDAARPHLTDLPTIDPANGGAHS